MKQSSQVLLLELFKILLRGSKSILEELKRKKMLINMHRDSLSTKMTLQQLILLVVNLETLLLQENVENSQLFMFGIISRCNLLEVSSLEHRQKEQLHQLSVLARDMQLLLTKAMSIQCIFIMFKEKKCFFSFLLEVMLFSISNGQRNQMILDLSLFQQDLFNFGIQLMQVKNFLRMEHSELNFNKLNFHVL